MKRMVIDMLGGDNSLNMSKEAVALFHKEYPLVPLLLVGPKDELKEFSDCKIIDATEVVPMECGALEALRHRSSSLVKAINAMKEENGGAIVSAGSTGALLSLSAIILKKIPGVLRPALVTAFPKLNKENEYVTLLDVGASSENTKEELAQFALMGSLYSKIVYSKEKPLVKLLSNGEEEGKGSTLSKETYVLLKDDQRINFGGNVEGNGILLGDADVVVSDGFSGNIMLKSTEGAAKGVGVLLKKMFLSSLSTKIGYLFSKKGVKKLKETLDPKKVGGALLIGVNGIVVKAHGNSDAYAFKNALVLAYKLLEEDICQKISEGLYKERE